MLPAAAANKRGIQEGRFVLTVFCVLCLLLTGQVRSWHHAQQRQWRQGSALRLLSALQVLLDMYNQHRVYLGEKQRAFVVASYLNQKFPFDPGVRSRNDMF